MNKVLEIRNLSVSVGNKEILNEFNLTLEQGRINVLMGKNGSGKSTLANVLMGNPKYKVNSGKIIFNGKDITNLKTNEIAKKGIFLSFQHPTEVSGLSLFKFLRESYNLLNKNKLSIFEFKKLLEEKAKDLKINFKMLDRYLNEGFSGGEKKKFEILQLLVLNPKFAILDEVDSGLDIDSMNLVSKELNRFMNKDKTILLITHYNRFLKNLNPDKIFVISEGKIIKEGNKEILDDLEEKGYSWVEEN